MNKIVALSGIISFVMAIAHIGPGGVEVHDPVLASNLGDIPKGYVSTVWHMVTAQLLISSLVLFYAALNEPHRQLLVWMTVIQYSLFGCVFVYYNLTRFGSVLEMPPWIGFFLISAIAAIGILSDRRKEVAGVG